jgi:hypothetical protein
MALIDLIFKRQKTLSQLSPVELRREEIIIGKQRDKLLGKIEDVANQKKRIFEQGAKSTSPELRKALAGEFELKSKEQLMAARELNVRSKELLTVSRLRMVKEHQGKGRALGRLKVTDTDMAKISGWIEDDAVTQDLYTERLDQLLELGERSDTDALNATKLGDAGSDLMALWDKLDSGTMQPQEALQKAEEAVRRRTANESSGA